MGFMGIKNWVESDEAANFQYKLRRDITRMFHNELKNKANEYNTPGYVNALLIFKSYPDLVGLVHEDTLDAIDKAIDSDVGYLKGKDGAALIRNFFSARYISKKEEIA